jgi:small subunit ribosomal protein S9
MATAEKSTKKAVKEIKSDKSVADKTAKKLKQTISPKIPSGASYGTGKRKCAIAKVWVFPGKGNLYVNDMVASAYFTISQHLEKVTKPLDAIGVTGKYDVIVQTYGGGIAGQADAVLLGVARALLELNLEFRAALKAKGYLTRDPRIKERKKYGRKKARKGFQYRKR